MTTIPHLNTLRTSRSQARGGSRGYGLRSAEEDESKTDGAKEKIIQQTDQDASVSRVSAVSLGYLDDPFASEFLHGQPSRRYPIINRGTYVRTTAIDALVDRFLSVQPALKKQIISLGAGSDTRYFRLASTKPSVNLVYYELDFPANTAQKIASIEASSKLSSLLQVHQGSSPDVIISSDKTVLSSPKYHIHPLDIRTLASPDGSSIRLPHVDALLPTLILSECCLIYIPPSIADNILKSLTSQLIPSPVNLGFLLYEPIRPYDPFGKVMVSNLKARGIYLETLKKYSSLYRQRERMKTAGFSTGQGAVDTLAVWRDWVGSEEKERVGRVEMLDEVEEWELLAKHYCIAWGWRDGPDEGQDVFSRAWGDVIGRAEGNDDEEY